MLKITIIEIKNKTINVNEKYANNFYEILTALAENEKLKENVIDLIKTRHIPGKLTEENARKDEFRKILIQLINREISTLESAYHQVEITIPEHTSRYVGNTHVFPRNWAERHVRTQLSRFYNQAIMELLLKLGKKKCFIPHSPMEDSNSICTINMAGKEHEIKPLYDKLIEMYENENWDSKAHTIPQHPNCTHTIRPIS